MTPQEFVAGIGMYGAIGLGFFLSLLVAIPFLFYACTDRYHRKHHTEKNVWSLMCDQCYQEKYGK